MTTWRRRQNITYLGTRTNSVMWPSEFDLYKTWNKVKVSWTSQTQRMWNCLRIWPLPWGSSGHQRYCSCSRLQQSSLVWKVQMLFVLQCSVDDCFPLDERYDTLVYPAISFCATRTPSSNLSLSVRQHHGNVSKLVLCSTFWYRARISEVL